MTASRACLQARSPWLAALLLLGAVALCAVAARADVVHRQARSARSQAAAAASCDATLGPADVLILVNANSPCSRSVAELYRRYYWQIADNQVLSLGGVPSYPAGLKDCAAPTATAADEIITRDQFEKLIAQPVRDYLVSTGRVNTTYLIITTAGMPYRIKDSNPTYANVVCTPGASPFWGGSDANLTVQYRNLIDAASVEAELSVLFQIDPALPSSPPVNYTTTGRMPIQNRAVNPYQGYRSRIKCWSTTREGTGPDEGILNRRANLNWTVMKWVSLSPKIEGTYYVGGYTALNRKMSAADLYLVARLDAPRGYGRYPIFAIKQMLDRAMAASDPYVGYNPVTTDVVIDDSAACCSLQCEPSYNLRPSALPSSEFSIDFATWPQPPGGEDGQGISYVSACHHDQAMLWLTGSTPADVLTWQAMLVGLGTGRACIWDGTSAIMSSTQQTNLLGPNRGIIGLVTYGRNGQDGRPAGYLLTSGPGGGPLFRCAPGAVFSSMESYNATTMFTNPTTTQAKIVDFITIGGTAAMGHAFEPEGTGLMQDDYLLRNLLRDDNGDALGDLTLAEAAYTAMPYLSWTAVLIGDPLMRLRAGPGGLVSLEDHTGDIDGDGYVGPLDLYVLYDLYGSAIGDPWYDPAADLDQDGYIGPLDLYMLYDYYGTDYTTQ